MRDVFVHRCEVLDCCRMYLTTPEAVSIDHLEYGADIFDSEAKLAAPRDEGQKLEALVRLLAVHTARAVGLAHQLDAVIAADCLDVDAGLP